MRPALALALGAAFTTLVVGCTLLVNFDDPPTNGAGADDDDDTASGSSSGKKPGTSSSSSGGTSSSSSSGDTSSSSSSSSSSSGGAAYPPACDKTQAVLDTANCGGKADGQYCGIATSADDLTQCEGGLPVCVFHCTMGCAILPTEPDQCADCKGPMNRPPDNEVWFCGKDAKWPGGARDYAYTCSKGKVINGKSPGGDNTPTTCGQDLCHTTCTRTNPPPLNGSCCQGTKEIP